MLIEQIIELELREPGPPSRTCTSKTGYFHEKQNFHGKYLSHYLLLKIFAEGNIPCFPPVGQVT